jgi:hypothetical protein
VSKYTDKKTGKPIERVGKDVRVQNQASDAVSPPVSDSTLKAVKQLLPHAKGKLPRKGWGE